MMRVGYTDLRIGAIVLLARELECHDARDIGLKRQNLQIEHEFRVIGKFRGDSDGPVGVGSLWILSRALSALDLRFHITNAFEILVQAGAIGGAHALLELRDIHAERIQETASITQPRAARRGVAAFTEQAFEDDARMRLGRQWSRWR